MFYPTERTVIFVDGPNIYGAVKALGWEIDFKKMRAHFANQGRLLRINYYTALYDTDDFNSIKPLTDWMSYNGFNVVSKPVKEYVGRDGKKVVKGNMDIEIAIDMMEIAPHIDHLILFSGDGDFRRLVEAMQRLGKRVTVISTIKTQPSMIADELRRQADNYVDLEELKGVMARDPNLKGMTRQERQADFEANRRASM